MKIAFIVGEFPKLSETFILNQVTGLIDRGQEVDIYANKPASDGKVHSDFTSYDLSAHSHYFHISGNQIATSLNAVRKSFTKLNRAPLRILRSWNKAAYDPHSIFMRSELPQMVVPFIDRSEYDIIHCHFGENGMRGLMLKQLGAVTGKLITTFHGYDISEYTNTFGDEIYNDLVHAGNLFCSISDRMSQQLLRLGCPIDKVKVHRVGIDCSAFKYKPRYRNSDEPTKLITVCRLVEKKGVEYAIRAVSMLVATYPQLSYTIIGDGPLMPTFRQLVEELGVSSNVHLVGWKQHEQVVSLLTSAHILVAPSVTSSTGDQEGIPVSIMEGMAMGLPILSTYHSGIPELVEDGVSGFLVSERDETALAKKMQELIKAPDTWATLGAEGRKRIEREHNIEVLNDQLVNLYKSLV